MFGVTKLITDEFKFEKQVRSWMLKYYQSFGYKIDEVIGKENRKGDLILKYKGRKIRIEEKARKKYYPDFLFEIVQDVNTKNWGWIYDVAADYIVYIFWKENEPEKIYKLNWQLCKKYILENLEHYKLKISKKGFGITIFCTVTWDELITQKIAELIYPPPER